MSPGGDDPSKSGSFIKLDVGARAELRAEIKTEIPSETSGRLLDALTDVIRPFTERRGLLADRIRLQREDVLIQIAKKARQRLELEGEQIQSVSNKFMSPFLEHASLEDEESELVEKWANLLASASKNSKENFAWCITVLSEINADEAKLLDLMYARAHGLGNIDFDRYTRPQAERAFNESDWVKDLPTHYPPFNRIVDSMERRFDLVRAYHERDIPNANEVWFNFGSDESLLSRLDSLGLVWTFGESFLCYDPGKDARPMRAFVVAASLTPKGLEFVSACSGE